MGSSGCCLSQETLIRRLNRPLHPAQTTRAIALKILYATGASADATKSMDRKGGKEEEGKGREEGRKKGKKRGKKTNSSHKWVAGGCAPMHVDSVFVF